MMVQSIIWRPMDQSGHEWAQLRQTRMHWQLWGTAVFAEEGLPCKLDYCITCDADWLIVTTHINGSVGDEDVKVEIQAGPDRRWKVNGVECLEVMGCIDIDLSFSPSTNTIPIRRLGLEIGQEAEVRAARLRFPSLTLEPLVQTYRRTGECTYRFVTLDGEFASELTVNEAGLVTDYPDLWVVETA